MLGTDDRQSAADTSAALPGGVSATSCCDEETATAFFTAAAVVFSYLPAPAGADVPRSAGAPANEDLVRFVDQGAYTDEYGRTVEFAVWLEEGELEADVSIFDPATRDALELWLEGDEVFFEGVARGERFRGSAPFADLVDANTGTPICIGWVALVCVGALVILATSGGGGCAVGEGCDPRTPTNQPGGGGGVPSDDSGGGDGDGGGGDGDD